MHINQNFDCQTCSCSFDPFSTWAFAEENTDGHFFGENHKHYGQVALALNLHMGHGYRLIGYFDGKDGGKFFFPTVSSSVLLWWGKVRL